MTGNVFHKDKLVMIFSVIPSAKYSCSGSPLIFVNGSTAMAGGFELPSSIGSETSGSSIREVSFLINQVDDLTQLCK